MTDRRPQVAEELSRDLTLFHIVMMGLGMMIGAGVFVGIGLSIEKVGPGGLILTFVLNGLVALFTAMSFAELSSAIPRAGGAYNFARIGFGRGASFVAGWMEWLASSLAGAFYAVVFASFTVEYLDKLTGFGLAGSPKAAVVKVVALAAAGLFIFINYRGSSETGKIGALFTAGQMLFVLLIAAAGVVTAIREPARLANFQPFMPNGWWRLLGAMGVIYVAFEGFEVIAQAGDEAIDPKRNIPKAMLYSVLIVTLTYVLVAAATVVAVRADSPELRGTPVWEWIAGFEKAGRFGFRAAVERLMPFGGLLVTLAVIFSSTSALNATTYSAARASYALGRDRMLPAWFARISPTRKTPSVALIFTALIVLTAAVFLDHRHGAACASIMFLFLFLTVNLCALKIRRNMGDELDYGYVMPLFPLLPVLAIGLQALLAAGIVTESYVAWIIAPTWVLAGVLIYRFYSRTRAIATADEIRVLEERAEPSGKGYGIMVAVANPDSVLQLVRATYRLCGAKDARVELLHMVPVPDQVPLSDAKPYMMAGKEGLVETMLYLAPLFPISTTIRYCRSVARGIISAVREKRINMLIMGWHGEHRAEAFHLGSTVDPVVERCPCDVVVLKGCGGNPTFRRVLVPLAGGPNGAFALEIAGILADDREGEVVAMTVATDGARFDLETFVNQHARRLGHTGPPVRTKIVQAEDVVRAILAEAAEHDLIVLGCTRQPILIQAARATVPELVARRCDKPVVMVRAIGGGRSWIRRWI